MVTQNTDTSKRNQKHITNNKLIIIIIIIPNEEYHST